MNFLKGEKWDRRWEICWQMCQKEGVFDSFEMCTRNERYRKRIIVVVRGLKNGMKMWMFLVKREETFLWTTRKEEMDGESCCGRNKIDCKELEGNVLWQEKWQKNKKDKKISRCWKNLLLCNMRIVKNRNVVSFVVWNRQLTRNINKFFDSCKET